MPLYVFSCAHCGSFECWRALAEATEPMLCPACGYVVTRVYTVPQLVHTPVALAQARLKAEKSAYEPEVISHPDLYRARGPE